MTPSLRSIAVDEDLQRVSMPTRRVERPRGKWWHDNAERMFLNLFEHEYDPTDPEHTVFL